MARKFELTFNAWTMRSDPEPDTHVEKTFICDDVGIAQAQAHTLIALGTQYGGFSLCVGHYVDPAEVAAFLEDDDDVDYTDTQNQY